MSQTVITQAFEELKAQEAANGGVLTLDEFVFASVPNLNITDPIDRTEGLPPAAQIVHRQAVSKTGMVNGNAVVYSVVLGADVGDFEFNWVGLLNKASGVVAMIVHAPSQKKIKTASGQQGNVLTRSFLMEYNGASEQTQIITPADTWQIDFTARLNGVDERIRQENCDVYGQASFMDDGFLVSGANGNYLVKKGVAYIEGLRAELLFDQAMAVAVRPSRIWVDVCWRGTLTSVWAPVTKLTVADSLVNYVTGDEQHYVFAIAEVLEDGSVIDLRQTAPLAQLMGLLAEPNVVPYFDNYSKLKTSAISDFLRAVLAIPDAGGVLKSLGLSEPGGLGFIGPGVMTRGADKFSILQGQSGEMFSSDFTRGLALQLNAPITGSGYPVSTAKINLIEINADKLNVVDDTAPGTKVDGLMVFHKYGGAGTKGGRHAIEAMLSQNDITDSSNTDRNYVGIAGTSSSSIGDGGTSAAEAKGTYYGGNFVGILNPGATYVQVVTGAEFNAGIKTGASANIRTGLQIGSLGNERGGAIDAALMVGCGPSNPAWRSGIHFGKQSGASPFDSTSRAIRVDVDQVDSIISVSPTTNVNKLIDSQKVILTPSVFAMRDSAAFIEVGSDTTAGSTQLRFRTSGTGVASDAAIIVSGGNATSNNANLEFKAGAITYSCSQRPNIDNVYDYGAANFRGRTAYFGTGAINTSDARHKPVQEQIPDAVLDAWAAVEWRTWFKFDDAIAIKGKDGARWHFGLIAQRVEKIFADHGIDGFSLGLLCYDEWDDQYVKVLTNEGAMVTKSRIVQKGVEVKKVRTLKRPVMTKVIVDLLVDDVLKDGTRIKRVVSEEHETPVTVMVPVVMEDGTPHPQQPYVSEVVTEEVEEEYIDVELIDVEEEYTEPAEPEFVEVLTSAAGTRYGIRYEEALSLEAALQRRNYELLLRDVEVLKGRIEVLENGN